MTPNPEQVTGFAALVAIGALGGWLADIAGLPLPYMIGGLAGGFVAVAVLRNSPAPASYPPPLRKFFVAVIGAMIGGTFTPDVLSLLPSLPVTLGAVTVFVPIAHATGFVICRQIGRYDVPTAFFGSMPGGLVEGIMLGERAGGDVRILTLQHFSRVIFVATFMPFLFWAWSGQVVGSAAGTSIERGSADMWSVVLITVIAIVGLLAGRVIRLPASHLMGPLLVAAALQVSGMTEVAGPDWLLALAQLMVGCGLAMQVTGTTLSMAGRVVAVSLTMVTVMTLLGVGLALAVGPLTDIDREALVLSLAPGGISEMGLIALSLNLSPVIVAAHHLYRITLTVLIAYLGLSIIERRA